MTTTFHTTVRNQGLDGLLATLQLQNARKYDAVVPLQAIESHDGLLHIAGMGQDGPNGPEGVFTPSDIMDGHIAERLGIPVKYLRYMRESRMDLYDANVNGLIHGHPLGRDLAMQVALDPTLDGYVPDMRTMLVRTFTQDDGPGIGRALLSQRYASYDNLDMLFALLEGIAETGVEARVKSADLTERRMVVKIEAPEIVVHATELLKGYRSPFGDMGGGTYGTYGQTARQEGRKVGDLVSAGLVATNSETGGGAWSVAPYATVLQCTNGMVINKQMMRTVHLGGTLEVGEVKWSEETEEKNVGLITAKTRDAVTAFLDKDFLEKVIADITEKATKPIENPAAMVELVSQKMAYTDAQQQGILDHFIKGGQLTTGGILQAVTSFAQEIENPDVAFDFESSAIDALEAAYANA